MFARFLDTSAIDRFVAQVVDELVRAMPPDRVDRTSQKGLDKRAQLDRRIVVAAQKLNAEARPNLFLKAQLGTRLEDALNARGYLDVFSKEFAVDVVKLLASL